MEYVDLADASANAGDAGPFANWHVAGVLKRNDTRRVANVPLRCFACVACVVAPWILLLAAGSNFCSFAADRRQHGGLSL